MFGVLILGAAGCGKTTFATALKSFYQEIGRDTCLINLDPAVTSLPYKPDINIRDYIKSEEIMKEKEIGPNGSLIFCLEEFVENSDWFFEQLESFSNHYLIFDCPGQIEIFTHGQIFTFLLKIFEKKGIRLCACCLQDVVCALDAGRYLSSLLTTLSITMNLEIPHLNFISKLDMLKTAQDPMNLIFDLEFILKPYPTFKLADLITQENQAMKNYHNLSVALCDVFDEFGLVSFLPLSVMEKEKMTIAIESIDHATGYVYTEKERETLEAIAEQLNI
eukprot:TRINITY_DN14241_c0_g1_i1.p1 TRINITY_DN14241_c0_g1~~TRINITY_DN14241_c0_g1_i1.p1  ORF type:complete len:277 (-),score=71.71 TRINITY_DN14241_c0_g1_i1:171-1001(-)